MFLIHLLFSLHLETILLFFRYSKTQKMKGKRDGICRFLPGEVAKLLARFLTQVKPLEARFMLSLGQQAEADDTRTFLFTKEGKKVDGEVVTRDVARVLKDHDLKIGFLEYRHAAVGLNRANTHQQQRTLQICAALQTGHSLETDTAIYALATQDFLPADLERGFQDVSESWQALIRIERVSLSSYVGSPFR